MCGRTTVARRVQTVCIKCIVNRYTTIYVYDIGNGIVEIFHSWFRQTYLDDLIVFGHVLVTAQEISHGVCHVSLGHRIVGGERFCRRRRRSCKDYMTYAHKLYR